MQIGTSGPAARAWKIDLGCQEGKG